MGRSTPISLIGLIGPIGLLALGLAGCSGAKSEADQPDVKDKASEPNDKETARAPAQPSEESNADANTDTDTPTVSDRKLPEGIKLRGDCIAFDPTNDKSGPGPSIAHYADIDLDKLEALMPVDPRDPDLGKTKTTQWNRGDAGHGSPLVNRFVDPEGGESLSIQITDLQHICTCDEGMGQRKLDHAKKGGFTVETIGGHEVAIGPEGKSIGAWAGDRCELGISAASKGDARAIAEAVDWAALEALCKVRDPGGFGL